MKKLVLVLGALLVLAPTAALARHHHADWRYHSMAWRHRHMAYYHHHMVVRRRRFHH